MAETKEDFEKERELEKKKEKEKTKPSFFSKVPTIWKIVGIAFIVIMYLKIQNDGGSINKVIIWILIVLAIWYIMGNDLLGRQVEILTPEEAYEAAEKHIHYLRTRPNPIIERNADVYLDNANLFHSDGMPQHYQIGATIITENSKEYKRLIVMAEGPTKRYTTMQDSFGKLTGREAIPVKSPLPTWLKRGKKAGLDTDRLLYGDK